jgi:hypothetical protein
MILMSALVSMLSGKVPARNGVPSSDQYTQAIKDAVSYFSRDASREKIATLNVVGGTATYALPADFMRMIQLVSLSNPTGIFITNAGIIPIGNQVERYTLAGGNITFYPTPGYTLEREYRYAAGWALTADDYDDYYEDMTDAEAAIVVLKAQAECLGVQLDQASSGVVRYRIGDEEYDKGAGISTLSGRIEKLEAEYAKAVKAYQNQWSMSTQWQS